MHRIPNHFLEYLFSFYFRIFSITLYGKYGNIFGSRQANLVLIAFASSEGSGEQSRQNLRCSLIQAVSQEEPSDRKPDPWPLWMARHAQLKFVMTECSKTQIRLTRPIWKLLRASNSEVNSPIWPKSERVWDFMPFLNFLKFHEDPIKNEWDKPWTTISVMVTTHRYGHYKFHTCFP